MQKSDERRKAQKNEDSKFAVTRIIDNGGFERNTKFTEQDTVTNIMTPDVGMDEPVKSIGDFRLMSKLGEGAMGVVYKAYQTSFERVVAVKVLFKQVANNPKLVERLYREALVMGRLDHPNIVRGYGVGEDQGWHYFAMEYINGASLQSLLDKVHTFSVGDALYVTIACARGLQHAHENGLIHRDIKPDNILITRQGKVKIADLGMVKNLDEDMALTQTGHAVGTPWYMPLEQARNSKDTDGRCDIYALGCVLYALITGKPPFRGNTIVDVIKAKEAGTFPPARKSNADVPERLDLFIAKMTAKHASHRYRDCNELIADLESLGIANTQLSLLQRGKKESEVKVHERAEPAPKTNIMSESPLKEKWYIRLKLADGREHAKEVTTQQLIELLQRDNFDASTEVSRDPRKDFRALATYREFRHLVLGRVSKKAADEKAVRYRSLYERIEKREKENEKVLEDKPKPDESGNFEFWFGLGIKAGAVIGAIVVIIIIIIMLGKALNG